MACVQKKVRELRMVTALEILEYLGITIVLVIGFTITVIVIMACLGFLLHLFY